MSKRSPTNYQNGLIYTIRERGTDNIFYVGSTVCLRKRRNRHKYCCTNVDNKSYNYEVYQYIRSIGGWEMIILEELHAFPCDTRQELELEEGSVYKEYIGKGYVLKNGQVPGRTNKQYKQDNRERIAERDKQKVTCDCGSNVRKYDLNRHKRSKKHQKWEQQQ